MHAYRKPIFPLTRCYFHGSQSERIILAHEPAGDGGLPARPLLDHPRGSSVSRDSGTIFRSSKLNLVDLAGSERLRVSNASGQRLEECKYINASLAALGNVVAALTNSAAKHIPYRDSKLTRLLADSLGGNTKTTMVACVAAASMAETLSTLKFASRARHVQNSARINESMDPRSRLFSLERQLERLRAELHKRESSVIDARRFVEVEARRKRAEADRLEALRELEARSREVLREKAANAMLADQIARMESERAALSGQGVAECGPLDDSHSEARAPILCRISSNPTLTCSPHENQAGTKGLDVDRADACGFAEVAESAIRPPATGLGTSGALDRRNEQIDGLAPTGASQEEAHALIVQQTQLIKKLHNQVAERDAQIAMLHSEAVTRETRIAELQDALDRKTAQLIHLQRLHIEKLGLHMSPICDEYRLALRPCAQEESLTVVFTSIR